MSKRIPVLLVIAAFAVISLFMAVSCIRNEPVTAELILNGGKGESSYTFYEGQAYDIEQPTRFGYDFSGWYTDAGLSNALNENDTAAYTRLYAAWTKKTFTVTYDIRYEGGTAPEAQSVLYLDSAAEPEAIRDGHTLEGWYSDSGVTQLYDFSLPVTSDITVYAKWTINYYSVSFNMNYQGAISPSSQAVLYNGKASEPEQPSRAGYNFLGWYLTALTAYDFNTPVTADTILYAKWELAVYIITFNSMGGSAISEQSLIYPSKVSKPADPTRDGYQFNGWYTDEECTVAYDFNASVSSGFTLYAGWLANLIYTDSGSYITVSGIRSGATIINLTIPSSYSGKPVTTIAEKAFFGNSTIETVAFPNSVTSIGDYAFAECSALLSFSMQGTNNTYLIINSVLYRYTFRLTSSIYTASLVQYPIGLSNESFTVPDKTVEIAGYAFSGAINLKEITFVSTVTSLGEYAFSGSGINSISLPSAITACGSYAFYNCDSLVTAVINNALTYIPTGMFEGSGALEAVTLGTTVLIINESAFSGCTSLTAINFNDILQMIDSFAFNGCTALETVTLPNSLSSVNTSVFSGCTMLSQVAIGSGLHTLGISMFNGCTSLAEITLPVTVNTLSEMVFYGCSALQSIVLPDGITDIPISAFYGCSSLTDITFGSSVLTIQTTAFANCTALVSVTIPASITYIGTYAFGGCSKLLSVYILAAEAPSIGLIPFNLDATVYYPSGASGYGSVYWIYYDREEF